MVAPEEEEVLRVLDLVGEQQADRLQRLLPPVHVVAQEKVVRLGREPPVLKQPQQIVVLCELSCRRFTNQIPFSKVSAKKCLVSTNFEELKHKPRQAQLNHNCNHLQWPFEAISLLMYYSYQQSN